MTRPQKFHLYDQIWKATSVTTGESDALEPKHEVRVKMRRGRGDTIVPFCDPAALWEWEEGKDRKEDANEWVQRSRREGSVWLHRRIVVEGSKGGRARKEGGRCWCFAVASGVVEILQQRASPLLSNVHLILQILEKNKTTTKHQLLLLTTLPKENRPHDHVFFVFHPLSFRTASD